MLVIIVGGIPIAMPTVLSVTLALGAYKLAKEGAIVARMSAVEEMAGMDILCSDKTGEGTCSVSTASLATYRATLSVEVQHGKVCCRRGTGCSQSCCSSHQVAHAAIWVSCCLCKAALGLAGGLRHTVHQACQPSPE